ncbi:hypothetical protein HMPREF0765_0464 [Sphingobacterium spiritivorum ATCC 33300]|uniref:Thiol-disulfide oxidoreductase DCC n=1 Tax=Sphingobacterium spiritivorum ATCC 33300 TaxID=525372 RepID=C2FT08_SPHSI|nr:DCC1-like thiol-disulfide oxidoreductase family protein [Sphingobacterium spiritivorum]EEI93938.1 hypothetical protein HMPREF0765_0464 [Sphingobacterium spiritivorum ATCC 33300]QQS94407.1 DUF393 domain-containing protein [Sphingobacterium spiritivorum]
MLHTKNIVLFDGICNVCNGTVNFIMKHDKQHKFYFSSLQSPLGQQVQQQTGHQLDSILYIRQNKIWNKSNAVLYIAKDLGFPWSLCFIFKPLPTSLRDRCYDFIARNRYKWFGKREQCRIPTAEERQHFI